MDEFEKNLTEQNLSEFSVKTYIASMKRLTEIIGMYYEDIDYGKVKMIEKKIRNSDYSLNTKKSMVTAILKYVEFIKSKKIIVDKWVEVHNALKRELMTIEKENKIKPSEEDKFMPYDEMKEKFLAYYYQLDDKNRYDVFLLGCLLLLPAPTRLGNYRNLQVKTLNTDEYKEQISKLDDNTNYIIRLPLKTRISYFFIFNDYKTSETLGRVVVQVNDDTLKDIIEHQIGDEDDVIFDDINPSNQTVLLKRLTQRIYGKSFSVNIIRHAFITHIYDNEKMSVAKKEEILKLFGNKFNPNQSDLYYRLK